MNPIEKVQRDNYFKELVKMGVEVGISDDTAPRLVVLVRDDILPPVHQGIQAAHSIVCLSTVVKIPLDVRSFILLLGATQEEVGKLRKKVKGYANATYCDVGLIDPSNGLPILTACAFEPMSREEKEKYFGHLSRAR
jgi:hypothetical protein